MVPRVHSKLSQNILDDEYPIGFLKPDRICLVQDLSGFKNLIGQPKNDNLKCTYTPRRQVLCIQI